LERERWVGLHAASVSDYIDGVLPGFIDAPFTVSASSGRNTVWLLHVEGQSPAAVKQFGESDHDYQHFRVERDVLSSSAALPTPRIYAQDSDWRVIVMEGFSNQVDARTVTDDPVDIADELLNVLQSLDAPIDGHAGLPGILAWSGADVPTDKSAASLRLWDECSAHSGLLRARGTLRDAWTPEALIHGDLKLDHVFRSSEGLRIVDWENATHGLRAWDGACLLQSLMASAVWFDIVWEGALQAVFARLFDGMRQDGSLIAAAIAVRLAQTAIEWETGRSTISRRTAGLMQLATHLADDSRVLESLLGRGT
jgi:aminoglycoside phosphotransferase (APT) family kinase protein